MQLKQFVDPNGPRLFYGVLLERTIDADAAAALMDVAAVSLAFGAVHLYLPYQRTDMARNNFVRVFLRESKNPGDVLVMMDADHIIPRETVVRLASQIDEQHEVIGALAFRRSLPHDPVYYTYAADGGMNVPTEFSGGLERADVMGTGTIALRRSVFDKLTAAGVKAPFFRYYYADGEEIQRSEDWDFALQCQKAGISHWCDTGVEIPHITKRLIGRNEWFATLRMAHDQPASLDPVVSKLGLRFDFGDQHHGANGHKPGELVAVGEPADAGDKRDEPAPERTSGAADAWGE